MRTLLAGALALGMTGAAQAAVLWEFEETATGVVGTMTGSLDLTGGVLFAEDPGGSAGLLGAPIVLPSTGELDMGLKPAKWFEFVGSGIARFGDGIGAFGPGSMRSASGDQFAIVDGGGSVVIGVGKSYTSGAELGGTISFETTVGAPLVSFDTLGITPGTYVATLANSDTVTVVFNPGTSAGVSEVPVPAALPLLAAGLGALGVMRRRRG